MALGLDRRPLFGAVLEVLSREDPEGLLAAGAPADEYAHEAADLAERLRAGRPITGDVVVELWERWFGPGSAYVRRTPKPQVDGLAAELDALRERCARADPPSLVCAMVVRARLRCWPPRPPAPLATVVR